MKNENCIFSQICFLFILYFSVILCFNIDTKYPLLINNHADGEDSYFGASLILLKELPSADVSWLIIGSPRANSTSRILNGVYEPGQLWRCSIGFTQEKCEVVVVDPKNINELGLVDRKDGGWLGGAITSHGKRFVTCASRWQNQNANRRNDSYHYFMNGQCYWRPKADLLQSQIPDRILDNYRLYPLADIRQQSIRTGKFYWMVGQAGFSSHVSELDELILGGPGIDQWRGGFVRYFDSANGSLSRNGDINEYSTMFTRNFISRPEIDNLDEEESTLFGYAVSSGKFFKVQGSGRKVQYVGGGPRGNSLAGRVVDSRHCTMMASIRNGIYHKASSIINALYANAIFQFPDETTAEQKLKVLQILDGEQIGSYFGSVLLSVDLNSDGYDDLLVGAPNYNTKIKLRDLQAPLEFENLVAANSLEAEVLEKEQLTEGFLGDGDEGSVFLFMSNGASLIKSLSLVGGNSRWSHFGSAITSLGDINNDGFKDIAIGSPYEDDHGAVYIYFGTSSGIQKEYSQVIKARSIDMNLRGFGYSLASEQDIDKNGYNDLSIGAYASNQVVILRTKPVIKATAEIRSNLEKLSINATEFEFQSCISYTGFKAPLVSNFGVKIFMDAEAFPARVHVKINDQLSNSTYVYVVKTGQNYVSCSSFTATVKTHLSVTGKPIIIEQEVYLLDEGNEEQLPFSRIYDITRSGPTYNLRVNGPELKGFCESCPALAKLTKPFFFKLPLAISCNSVDRCISDLIVNASFPGIEKGGSFTIGSSPSVILKVTVENRGDAAFSPTLEIWWRRRNLIRIPPNCQKLENNNFMSYECSLGQILEPNKVMGTEFEIDMRGIYAGSPDFEGEILFDIKADTASDIKNPNSAALAIALSMQTDIGIGINASQRDVNYNPTGGLIAAGKFALFRTYLKGISPVSKVWLDFEIPVNITSGSKEFQLFLLNNYQATVDRHSLLCSTDSGALSYHSNLEKNISNSYDSSIIDVEFIESSALHNLEHGDLRRKREANFSEASYSKTLNKKKPPTSNSRKVLSLDCSMSSVKCLEVHCVIENFEIGKDALVEFSMTSTSEIINSVMKREKVQSIHIHSYAYARIINIDSKYQTPNHDFVEAYATTIIRPVASEVPSWVYIVSVVGGLLLLGVIVLCCYSLGYFKRKRKAEEDQIENNGKHDVVDYADDNKEDPNETSPLQNENKNNTQEELDYVTDNDETEQVRENTSFSRR